MRTPRFPIDHVTLAGSELKRLERSLSTLGFRPLVGGPHDNGITEMSCIPLPDQSYVELISTRKPGETSPLWPNAIAENGGPCAWAILSSDLTAEVARLQRAGIPTQDPRPMSRRRGDGFLLEWELALLGPGPPGTLLPFAIRDLTPRKLRVDPTLPRPDPTPELDPVRATERPRLPAAPEWVTGIATVVLGVRDLDAAVSLFRKAYDLPAPRVGFEPSLGAKLARFHETPVTLASPSSNDSPLADRLEQFGDSPCGFLFGADEAKLEESGIPRSPWSRWSKERVAWIEGEEARPLGLGVMVEG